MKDFIDTSPLFPVYDINFDWEKYGMGPLLIIFDKYLYNLSDSNFDKHFYNHQIIDSRGYTYLIKGKKAFSRWRRLFPLIKKGELIFKNLNKEYTTEDVKTIIIEKIDTHVDDINFKNYWINETKKAQKIEDVFMVSLGNEE